MSEATANKIVADDQPAGAYLATVYYGYDELARLESKTYGTGVTAISEMMSYNIQDWLTNKSNPKFNMKLRYHNPQKGTEPSYTGNITEWDWQHKNAHNATPYTLTTAAQTSGSYVAQRLSSKLFYRGSGYLDMYTEGTFPDYVIGNRIDGKYRIAGGGGYYIPEKYEKSFYDLMKNHMFLNAFVSVFPGPGEPLREMLIEPSGKQGNEYVSPYLVGGEPNPIYETPTTPTIWEPIEDNFCLAINNSSMSSDDKKKLSEKFPGYFIADGRVASIYHYKDDKYYIPLRYRELITEAAIYHPYLQCVYDKRYDFFVEYPNPHYDPNPYTPDPNDSSPMLDNVYAFSYDKIGRLIDTKQLTEGVANDQFVEKGIQYDKNGNIKTMKRFENGSVKDDFEYLYSGNQLMTTNAQQADIRTEVVDRVSVVINTSTNKFAGWGDITGNGSFSVSPSGELEIKVSNNREEYVHSPYFKPMQGKEYTLTFMGRKSANCINSEMYILNYGTYQTEGFMAYQLINDFTSEWKEYKYTFTCPSTITTNQTLRFDNNGSTNGQMSFVYVKDVKLEIKESTYTEQYVANPDYTYDGNGNMIHDGLNDLDLTYNNMNLIESVSRGGIILAKYSYLSDGTKLSATDADGNGLYYSGSLVYRKQGDSFKLESAGFSGGRIVASETSESTAYTPYYFLTDHLGSTRVVVDGSNGELVERNDYYAFGGRWEDGAQQTSDNRYRYNGKEEQSFLGLPFTDYGARQYDSRLGRWFGLDPLAEKYYSLSSYNYCLNNPVKFIDPLGEAVYLYYSVIGNSHGGKPDLDADEMFMKAALTRAIDMLRNGTIKEGDVYHFGFVDDIGKLQEQVESDVARFSPEFGQTAEFGLWSHGALQGPTGSVNTTGQYISTGEKQMSPEGWGAINFNWQDEGARAMFYGCRTASPVNDAGFAVEPWAQTISGNSNMQNVDVYGQTTRSWPSSKPNAVVSPRGPHGYPTYMVGAAWKRRGFPAVMRKLGIPYSPAPMAVYRNGSRR